MNVVIIDKVVHPKGILFTFEKKGKQVKILFFRPFRTVLGTVFVVALDALSE
jgi:hypothetical protein